MPRFRVLLHGRNFQLKLGEGQTASGFYTTRFVEAGDAHKAELLAVQMIRDDPHLNGMVMNDATDSPLIDVTEMLQVEDEAEQCGPGRGYTFYSATEK